MAGPSQEISKSWYLVYTKPRGEEHAFTNLSRQGFQAYLPRLRHWRKRRGKRVEVVEPLFPRYLFVQLDTHTDNWAPIRSTPGVASLVRFGNDPARVPEDFVRYLQSRESEHGLHEWAEPEFYPGEAVRVAEGPLTGFEGILLAATGSERVLLLLHMLGKEVRAQLTRSQIERLK